MGDFTENKFKSMVDEMTRFEEEIGMPYKPELKIPNPLVSQPFVIGTNTFSQAQRKILQINDGVPMNAPMFVPPQIIHGPPAPLPGGIPPPPPPPLSAPPAGMTFPPRLSMPYSQPIPPPPQPPAFVPSMMMRSEPTIPAVAPVSSAPVNSFPRRTTPTWPLKNPFRPPTPTKIEPEPKPPVESPPKVVLSATPKLYTPKVETADELNYSNYSTRITMPEPTRPSSFNNRKSKPEPTKYTPVTPVDIYSQTPNKKDNKKKKKCIRLSGGQTWEDPTLTEWEDGDFRLFAGDLGNDVTDELLTRIFSKYPSFTRARVVRDKRTNKTKGYGFISFKDPQDFIKASKEMNGRYVGSRPIKLRKSTWKNRNLDSVKKKEKEKAALIALLTGKS